MLKKDKYIKNRQKKILVIGHEASLTGAPILLLNLLQLVSHEYAFTIVLKKGGVLEEAYGKIAKTIILKNQSYSNPKSIFKMFSDRLKYFFKQIQLIPVYYKTDIIFSNTICNGRLLNRFRVFKKPSITYVHELETMFTYYERKKDSSYSLKRSSILAYPSKAVLKNLTVNHHVELSITKHLPYYFPLQEFAFSEIDKTQAKKDFCKKWDIPEDSFLIAGMGLVSERKGTDNFIAVAKEVIDIDRKIYFFWIGDFDLGNLSQSIKKKYFNKEYPHRIIFTGKLDYSTSNLLPFDLFFLSSNEDPYPLVVLEAAFQMTPAICYRNSGGIREFLADGCGFILDQDEFKHTAQSIMEISKDKKGLSAIAANAREKVISLHSNPIRISSIFKELVDQI